MCSAYSFSSPPFFFHALCLTLIEHFFQVTCYKLQVIQCLYYIFYMYNNGNSKLRNKLYQFSQRTIDYFENQQFSTEEDVLDSFYCIHCVQMNFYNFRLQQRREISFDGGKSQPFWQQRRRREPSGNSSEEEGENVSLICLYKFIYTYIYTLSPFVINIFIGNWTIHMYVGYRIFGIGIKSVIMT